MRKKLFLAAALAVIAVAGYVQHRNVNKQRLTDLQLANIEALAGVEGWVELDFAMSCSPDGDGCAMGGLWWPNDFHNSRP